jgi:hypothetical protein
MDDGGRRIDNSGWGSGRAPAPATGIPACAAAVRAGPLSCAFARRGGDFSGLPSPSLSLTRGNPLQLEFGRGDGCCCWRACSFTRSPASLSSAHKVDLKVAMRIVAVDNLRVEAPLLKETQGAKKISALDRTWQIGQSNSDCVCLLPDPKTWRTKI